MSVGREMVRRELQLYKKAGRLFKRRWVIQTQAGLETQCCGMSIPEGERVQTISVILRKTNSEKT